MAFVSEMFDQLRDLLNDASDTQVPFATKKLYINRGIHRLWPRVHRLVTATVTYASAEASAEEITGIADGKVLSVEYSSDGDADNYVRESGYDILPSDEDLASYFYPAFTPAAGSSFRIIYAAPIPTISAASYAAAQAESWTGPDRAMNLPVLYAMALIAARRIDDRQDHTRYSTTQAQNGVTDTDIMQSSQFWMGQFELELTEQELVLPVSRD